MKRREQYGTGNSYTLGVFALAFALTAVGQAGAQGSAAQRESVPGATQPTTKPQGPRMPQVPGTTVDRVVAIVNGDLVLDSDVDEELRFEAMQPYRTAASSPERSPRDRAIERLINRDLILQQAKLQPEDAISDEQVDKELTALRKSIPECKEFHCESDEGWKKFLTARGFTPEQMRERWRQRMQVLAFIEERFRMGIRISQADIKAYYDKTLVPEFARRGAEAPKLETVSDRIQEVLLQQQVSSLLTDWLRSLRAQGGIVVLHPGEPAP